MSLPFPIPARLYPPIPTMHVKSVAFVISLEIHLLDEQYMNYHKCTASSNVRAETFSYPTHSPKERRKTLPREYTLSWLQNLVNEKFVGTASLLAFGKHSNHLSSIHFRTNLSPVKDDRSKLSQICTSANQKKKDSNETGEIEKGAHGELML